MIEKKKELHLLKVLLAFLIATFLFSSGILIGYSVSYIKFQDVSNAQEEIKYDLLGINLEKEFITSCNPVILSTISSELDDMGKSIDILEQRFGKTDSRVLNEKKKYVLLEVQHFLIVKEYKETCSKNINIIFFFYSNSDAYENSRTAARIGNFLTELKNKNRDSVMIYSFDYELEMNMIKILKTKYDITNPNMIVLNENEKFKGIDEISNLKIS